MLNPSKTALKALSQDTVVSFVEMASVSEQGFITDKIDRKLGELSKGSYTYFAENDIIVAKISPCMENGKCALAKGLTNNLALGSTEFHVIRAKTEQVLPEYLFEVINKPSIRTVAEQNMTGSSGHRRVPESFYADLNIPLPPLVTQQQIVSECQAVDNEVSAAQAAIAAAHALIDEKIARISASTVKLTTVARLNPSKSEIRSMSDDTIVSFVEMASVSERGLITHSEPKTLRSLRKGSYTYFAENDIIIAKITPCMENGKCALATGLKNGIGIGSTEFHVIRANPAQVIPAYLFALLNRETLRREAAQVMTGASGHRRVPASFYEGQEIPLPSPTAQQRIVDAIAIEQRAITTAEALIAAAPARKQAILERYL